MTDILDSPSQTAWLVLTADDRQRRSNDGYDDDPSSHYSWDSTVPNREAVEVGHVIVLWDKRTVLGTSVIEAITQDSATKSTYRCPNCNGTNFRERKSLTPTYRCFVCFAEFEDRIEKMIEVTTYRSEHAGAWVDLYGALTGAKLRSLCEKPGAQNSIRRLDWPRFHDALRAVRPDWRLTPMRVTVERINGGHRSATVRVRVGQAAFRQRLLDKYGKVCAFTGPLPREALDAAHLYSYAKAGQHHEHGGLLLRKDLHAIFDLGRIAIDPATQRLDVCAEYRGFPEYERLHGAKIAVPLTPKQVEFIRRHWETHRATP